MNKSSLTGFFIVIGIILIIFGVGIFSYNGLVGKSEKVNSAFANIDTNLQRRMDLIPNLVNTVKGFASHETEIMKNVTDARTKLAGAGTVQEKANADSELTNALSRLMVVVENYPDLKSSENFRQLSDELAGTENRIAVARREYNEKVKAYNASIKKFPTNIMADMFNFESKIYFEANEGAYEVPNVEF